MGKGVLTFADRDLVTPGPILQTLNLEGVAFQVILCRRGQQKKSTINVQSKEICLSIKSQFLGDLVKI